MPDNDLAGKEELRPVSLEESKTMSENFMRFAYGIQIFANALQRQVATNLGLLALHQDKKFAAGVSDLLNGFTSRLAISAAVTYPCLTVRKYLQDANSSQFTINFSTAFIDAGIGTPIEANGMLKTMNLLGINVGKKDLPTMTARAFLPFFIRNQFSWCAINSTSNDDLRTRAFMGGFAGALSTPFHNIGVTAMENAPNKTWQETCNLVVKKIFEDKRILTKGLYPRVFSIAGASFLLDPQFTKILSQKLQEIFSDQPSSSPKRTSIKKVVDSDTQQKSK